MQIQSLTRGCRVTLDHGGRRAATALLVLLLVAWTDAARAQQITTVLASEPVSGPGYLNGSGPALAVNEPLAGRTLDALDMGLRQLSNAGAGLDTNQLNPGRPLDTMDRRLGQMTNVGQVVGANRVMAGGTMDMIDSGLSQSVDGNDPYGEVDEVGPFGGLGWSCGGSCPPTWRVRGEWLYFSRSRANDSLSTGFHFENNFPYQQAMRLTLDRRYDCTHGWEIVYAGPFNFHQTGHAGAAGTLSSNLATANGSGINLSSFFNANSQVQRDESQLQSVESVYKCWGWNVVATSWGIRYLNLSDDLRYRSVNANNEAGFLRANTNNNVVLGQFGWDVLFPIGRWSFDNTWKAAIGTSVGSSNVILNNAGITQINQVNQEANFAALIEGGGFVRYFVTPRITARVGYEFWWLYGVGLPNRQFGSRIDLNTGRGFAGNQDIFVYGTTAALEYVW